MIAGWAYNPLSSTFPSLLVSSQRTLQLLTDSFKWFTPQGPFFGGWGLGVGGDSFMGSCNYKFCLRCCFSTKKEAFLFVFYLFLQKELLIDINISGNWIPDHNFLGFKFHSVMLKNNYNIIALLIEYSRLIAYNFRLLVDFIIVELPRFPVHYDISSTTNSFQVTDF